MTEVIEGIRSIEATDESTHEEWLRSILNPNSLSGMTQIPKVPTILKEHQDHGKYYVPKVVSLGPYHYGNANLESVQDFKNNLMKGNQESIQVLYNNLAKRVHTLRGCYEDEDSRFSDDEFTRMMLLDGCFILYFIAHIFSNTVTGFLLMKSHQIKFVQQDMFLLENQIPYRVLVEVMKFVPDENWDLKIKRFTDNNILAPERHKKTRHHTYKHVSHDSIPDNINHLLELLHNRLTKVKTWCPTITHDSHTYTFRNVIELLEVGIRFIPSETNSLAHIEFTKHGFCANVGLAPIIVDDSTRPMLLNLVAYEMSSNDVQLSWVTSYICLLDSLIDHPEDVKSFEKLGLFTTTLVASSDDEVAQLFNQIGTGLVPNNLTHHRERSAIQNHYMSKRNTWMSQLKHEYIKTPWAFVALLVGLVGLFLSSVQTYFSVWGAQNR